MGPKTEAAGSFLASGGKWAAITSPGWSRRRCPATGRRAPASNAPRPGWCRALSTANTGFVLVSSYITPKARKGAASGIEGRGLDAVAPIAAGELVAIKGGHIVTTAALRSLPLPSPPEPGLSLGAAPPAAGPGGSATN